MARYTGAIFGSYELLDLIATGGMGEVYRARHRRLQGREAAVKVMPAPLAADPAFLQRFEREANSVAGLNHPHILPIWDYGEQDGAPYIVMPLVTGGSLRDHLHGRPIGAAALLRVLAPIASALDYAHQRGIVHRDIKPANVLLDTTGHLYLADFGIAKAIGAESESLTQTGVGIGTPEYMAPEQTEGRADQRSDIYALGVIAYEGLTGRVPFTGHTPIDVAIKHITAPLPPMASSTGTIDPAIEQAVRRALEKSPEARYQTAGAFVADLAAELRQNEAARPTGPLATPPPRADERTVPPVAPTTAATATTAMPTVAPPPPPAGTPPPPSVATTPAANRRPIVFALAAGLVLGLALMAAVLAFMATRGRGPVAATSGPTAAPPVAAAATGDLPFNFPVTNARIIGDYGRAQQLLQPIATDMRLRWIMVECFDPQANADCRLTYSFYSEQKQATYDYAFSFHNVEPPDLSTYPVDDDSQRVIFMQLPWERNTDWARLLRESHALYPGKSAPEGYSVVIGVEAGVFNRGEADWDARYIDKVTGEYTDYRLRGQTVTKIS